MYRIVKGDTALATVTAPTWVKRQENGCYTLSTEDAAQGVVVEGTVYHVAGKPEMEGCETVVLGEISETAYQLEQMAAQAATQLQTETALVELSILIANAFGFPAE